MGRIAAELAHRVWLTSDNPRSEDPVAILREIAAGVEPEPSEGYTAHPDRRDAIVAALGWARAGDTVVIAGKGHETYQVVGSQALPFDDRQVAREWLAARLRATRGGPPCPA
jgi:UDP-N-acetylmuramoyl-L-alanyl-D-glutamate--2,6-diaminopimelate ligase